MHLTYAYKRIRTWLRDEFFQRLLKNTGWLLGGTSAATAIGLIGLTLKTQSLGASSFGLLTVVLAYVALVEKLTSFKSWIPLIRFGAQAQKASNLPELRGYIRLSFAMDAAGATLGFIVALSCAHLFAQWQGWGAEIVHLLFIASLLPLSNIIEAPTGILRIFDRFKLFTLQKITESTLGCIGALVAWHLSWGVSGFLVSTIITVFCSRLMLVSIALLELHRRNALLGPSKLLDTRRREFLRFGAWSYISSIMDIPVKQLDTIVISAVLSLEASGIYRIIKQITNLLGLLTDPVYQAVYPQFSAIIAEGSFRSAIKYCAKIGALIVLIIAPVAVPLAATSQWWLEAFFGPDFRSGWAALSLFLILKVATLPGMPIHPLFTAAGYVRQNVWILGVCNAIYLLLLWKLSLWFGLFGPIYAWFLQVYLVAGTKIFFLLRTPDTRHSTTA